MLLDKSRYAEEAELILNNVVAAVRTCVDCATKYVIQEAKMKEIETNPKSCMVLWLNEFCLKMQENGYAINQTNFETLLETTVSSFESFEYYLTQEGKEVCNTITDYFHNLTYQQVKWDGQSPFQNVMDRLWGCKHQCPFCYEPCQWMADHRGKDHQCLQHRPQGIAGRFWMESKKLVLESCNWMISLGDQNFICTQKSWEDVCRESQIVDLAFLVDATGSMRFYINAVKDNIKEMISKVQDKYDGVKINIAFVGYRDYCDDQNRIVKLDFVQKISKFKRFVDAVKATGGGDAAEDVFGGLEEAGNLSWKSANRVLLHIADAPCHGSRFHDFTSAKHDEYLDKNEEDNRGLKIEDLLGVLQRKDIKYYFGKINSSTDKMITEFRKVFPGKKQFIRKVNVKDTSELVSAVADSVTATIHETVIDWETKGIFFCSCYFSGDVILREKD